MFAAVWTVATYHRGRGVTSPLARQLGTVLRSAVLPAAMSACMVEFAGFPSYVIPQSLAFAGGAAAVASFWRLTRWHLQAPVRVVVVGDRVAVTQAIARWQPRSRVRVVGGVVVEPDLAPEDVPSHIMGVPIRDSLADTTEMVAASAADLVVVSPGPGFTSIDFRRLGWALQDTGVKYGVMGVLDAVAAHRIVPGGLGGATLMDVRTPKPSTWVRAVKAVAERTVAAMLSVVVLPLLAVLMLAIRIDTRGAALFRQTRVGQYGRQFTVYKLRTMVDGADRMKGGLVSDNVDDTVLFKMRSDPRITRVGRFLRSTSLDELPQIFNVLLGTMSLVGPRPFLPAETAAMDADALRRLAVKPGITGLWQVSGRSDLSFREAADLDTYYADNWSLSGDIRICLLTVRAVLSRRGAY
jgi:exopolysaccharide biosynthesis polyprenyl glycosylphosphotransferase